MKTADAIAQYLGHLGQRGLEPSSIRTIENAVRTVLEPVITGDIQALAADGMGEHLREALGTRRSKNTRQPLTACTVELHINACKAFLNWAVRRGMVRSNPLEQPSLGRFVRELREAARLTRSELEQQTSVSATSLRALEYDRHRISRAIYDRLMRSPALARLPAMAKAAELPLPMDQEEPENHARGGSDPSRGKR